MNVTYRQLSTIAAALCAVLAVVLTFAPGLIYWLFQVGAHESAGFMARRAAMLFVGLGLIAWLGRDAAPSDLRRAICTGFAIMMAGLGLLGTVEFLRGFAGPGIFLAVAAEALFAIAYWRLR
ncbi:hypothetical protein [Aliiroseovarius marinus]|uniref:hypothetical protein n=1 Tax=Aliiroseovarius marinus TaxID=2500159 RepID=UPI003D7C668E